jgi:hypothetical protein
MVPLRNIRGRFEIETEAGTGGMGTVYRARDLETGAQVAVKVLQGFSADDRTRFSREAEALARLQHPAVVRYVAHGTTETGAPYLAMEWLDGEDLQTRLVRAPLTMAESVALAIRIAGALATVHAQGLVHRDIKPGNLFLVDKRVDAAKLIDFGLARLNSSNVTRSGMAMGTPGYMAPEQVRGVRELNASADLFSLGCVLFKCLTGRAPFEGLSSMASLTKVLLEDAPRVSSLRPEVPAELDDLVGWLLRKEPTERPPHARALIEALSAIEPIVAQGLGAQMAPPGWQEPALTVGEQRLMAMLCIGVEPGAEDTADLQAVSPETSETLSSSPKPFEATLAADYLEHTMQVERSGNHPNARVNLDIRIQMIVSGHGGRVDRLFNGVHVVTQVGAGNAVDDAVQVARCALALRAVLPEAPMAIAMAQSKVAGKTMTELPVGTVIDRGAALLEIAASATEGTATIRLDDVTQGLLAARFDVQQDEKGFLLCGEREAIEPWRRILGRPTPCLGRERELALLDALLNECLDEPVARAVLISGPPGIGKTRIMQEFLHKLAQRGDGPEVWITHGDALNAGSSFGMIARALRRAAGLHGGEPVEVQQSRLRARVARAVAPAELEQVLIFLGELCGVSFDDGTSLELRAARQDQAKFGEKVQWALEKLISSELRSHPLVFVLEDLHWGDLPSVRLLDAMLRSQAEQPFFVMALARPEVLETFPRLWSERALQVVSIGELGKKAGERLIKTLLGALATPQTTAMLLSRAAGNAFYLEELIRAVAEGRGDAIPDSVLAMVQARLQALEPEARRVLRAASVFGQSFSEAGVEVLLGGRERTSQLREWLTELVSREVIVRREESDAKDGQRYGFTHALVHEAAYAMLTDADRALGHRLASEWLEKNGERDAMLLAHHCERGGDLAHAGVWYAQAADDAFRGGDWSAALQRSELAATCGVAGETLGSVRWLGAEASRQLGDFKQAQRLVAEAMNLLPSGSPRWYQASRTALFLSLSSHYGRIF